MYLTDADGMANSADPDQTVTAELSLSTVCQVYQARAEIA